MAAAKDREKAVLCTWDELEWEQVRAGVRRCGFGNDKVMLVMNEVHPGMDVVPHSHDFDQLAVVVSGRMKFTVDGEEFEVGAGSALLIPAGQMHAGDVIGDEPALNLDVFSPPREDYAHLVAWMSDGE